MPRLWACPEVTIYNDALPRFSGDVEQRHPATTTPPPVLRLFTVGVPSPGHRGGRTRVLLVDRDGRAAFREVWRNQRSPAEPVAVIQPSDHVPTADVAVAAAPWPTW
jgi:hypothetical protein